MSPLRSLIILAGVLFSRTYAYVDFGSLTLPVEPLFEPTPRPEQLPEDYDLRYEILPSMITAVAPSVTLAGNGTRETMYSLHYHHYFSKTRQGRGKFNKRGVFSGDPPIATCNPCGRDGVYTPVTTSATNSVPCTTHTYHGVFDFPPSSTAAPCYNTNYTGVFQPSTSADFGLPCCFTIPASCRLNSTLFANTTTSFAASTGVFRPTSTSMTASLTTTSTSSRFSLSTPTSTSGSSSQSQTQGPDLNSGSTSTSGSISASTIGSSATSQSLGPILTSAITSTSVSTSVSIPTSDGSSSSRSQSQSLGPIINSGITSTSVSSSARTTVTVISGTTAILTLTTSAMTTTGVSSRPTVVSSNPYTSPSTSILVMTTSYSIIVISSSTLTLTSATTSTSGVGGISFQPTLTVITGSTTSFTSTSLSLRTSMASNTIIGCGVASGSGVIEGTGTVYLAHTSVTAIGSASGYASRISGCGTIIATTGSFSGNASITGCGFGYGIGTLTGMGTVWPWYGGGLLSFVSSGTVSGAGSFVGCGTITGSGTFSATAGSPVLITTTPRPTKTVSVYISYCPDPTGDANALFGLTSSSNMTSDTSPANLNLNGTSPLGYTSPYLDSNSSTTDDPPYSESTLPNPLCQGCPNSGGVCCPPTVSCDASDGKCPLFALENAGNTINGYLIQQVMNSTAPVAGRKKVRALARKSADELGVGRDVVRLGIEGEYGGREHEDTHRRAHHKRF